eukprot:CAMPEP_0117674044 /NCGR_PEP_ID=MMETSP0804-20121206/14815_1 /TAXON_ID=1074897 /ORGANISM="Tetraselmis astigmatica, Strain CCMP880" /LENGTH=192 /DNA_ID=CAMNT_0005482861 /DNA_START=136 /DNA_END=714 /DNA_ORIENTATION=-
MNSSTTDWHGSPEILVSVQNDHIGVAGIPSVAKMLSKHGDSAVVFADAVQKVNRKGVLKRKVLLLTDRSLYLLDGTTCSQRMQVPLQGIDRLMLSRFQDGFFAVFQPCVEKDLLLVSCRREAIANCAIQACARAGKELRVEHTTAFVHRLDATTVREVTFYRDEEGLIHTRLVSKHVRTVPAKALSQQVQPT